MNRMTLGKIRVIFGLVGWLTLGATSAQAEITLSAELSDGSKISDVAKLVAKAESAEGIDKVEFRVNDELRHTDTSIPYVYEWDTITDKEGMHAVSITAYDSAGSSKRITLSLTIDNELGLGADALAAKGREALRARNYAEATKYCRRSLKAEPNNISASRVLASIQAAQRNWSRAIAALQGANGLDTSAPAMRELASYRIQQALLPDNALNFFGELVASDELRRKAADIAVKETIQQNTPADGKYTPQQNDAIGDALIENGKFREAVTAYSRSAIGPEAPLSSVNRLALAYTLDERSQEAIALLRPRIRAKTDDAITRAVLGLALLRSQQFAEARATVEPDIANPTPATLIVAAYADAALGKRREASAMAKDAVGLLPTAGDAQYAYALSATDARESEQAIQRTLALAPFQSGPYLDYASRVVLSRRQDRMDQALNLTDFVLKHEPENLNAKLMQALLYLTSKRYSEAEPLLNWLQRKEKNAPDILLSLAAYWDMKEQGATVSQMLASAKRADSRFERFGPESPLELLTTLNRKYYYRSGFFLLPSTLYPSQG